MYDLTSSVCADHQTQLVAFEGQATQVNMLTRQLADQTRTLAATTGARNIALHGRASTWVKFSGNLSKRNMQRQAAVLEKQGVQTLSFWNQVQDEKCLIWARALDTWGSRSRATPPLL